MTRLQHQLRSLGDGHKVTNNIRVGDRHRAAALDLLLKQRNHTAMAAQHIAEAHGYAGHVCAAGEGLDQHFTQALGTAHDIGGVDGLIGGELDKTLHTVLCRRGQQILGAEYIVLDGLGRADLHKRHMLVGRSVKDNGRMVGVSQVMQPSYTSPLSKMRSGQMRKNRSHSGTVRHSAGTISLR